MAARCLILRLWREAFFQMKCGYEFAKTCLYSVQTYINIYACVCTMYIQRYETMNMYVHLNIFMYMYIPCTYMFMSVCKCMNIYVHVCTMFRHVCTVLPLLVQVVRIPDVVPWPKKMAPMILLDSFDATVPVTMQLHRTHSACGPRPDSARRRRAADGRSSQVERLYGRPSHPSHGLDESQRTRTPLSLSGLSRDRPSPSQTLKAAGGPGPKVVISISPGMYWMYWDVLGCIMNV